MNPIDYLAALAAEHAREMAKALAEVAILAAEHAREMAEALADMAPVDCDETDDPVDRYLDADEGWTD